MPSPLIKDSFNRPDGPVGVTETGHPWNITTYGAVPSIANNQLFYTNTTADGVIATFDFPLLSEVPNYSEVRFDLDLQALSGNGKRYLNIFIELTSNNGGGLSKFEYDEFAGDSQRPPRALFYRSYGSVASTSWTAVPEHPKIAAAKCRFVQDGRIQGVSVYQYWVGSSLIYEYVKANRDSSANSQWNKLKFRIIQNPLPQKIDNFEFWTTHPNAVTVPTWTVW